MQPKSPALIIAALGILALAVGGCGTSGTAAPTGVSETSMGQESQPVSSPGGGGGGSAAVNVTLQEWAVVPASTSATAGDVTFHIKNQGPEDEHEFVVIRTDLDPGDLPTDSTGAVDEDGEGIEVIDEVEEIAVDGSEDLTVDLEAGSYALICNIYDETEQESHYQMGMRIAFEVE